MILQLRSKYTAVLMLVLSLMPVLSQGQDIPFNCDYSAYLFQYNDVYAIDLASGNSLLAASDITPGNINAAAYNPADGFIWGYLSSPSKSIVRIGKNFTTTTYTIDALPTGNRYVGDISADGQYYFKAGGASYYTIDLDPSSSTYLSLTNTASLSQSINIHDWAFNAVDNQLYAVEKNSNILYRINPANGMVTALGEVPILSGLSYTYGAVYFDASGRFYVSANQTGTIYVIQSVQNVTTTTYIDSNLFAFGPSSASNDGARCPTAPVPQEICDNGIDDDGDGLIDCQDPSCSGYGSCDTIDPEASSADQGGLESTNRLSTAIAKRNYNRVKNNYSFERDLAPLVEKSEAYGMKTAQAINLQQFIPLEEIDEDYVVESTPSDLIAITNATDVFAVDYIRDELAVASILALSTEQSVYEHTKYICDRLLGASLLSVSTITIDGQPFIKSLIKNLDGSIEFVLSLSAKVTDDGASFVIESHWNLDKYQADTGYYNFQIWANSVDDLYRLGAKVIELLQVQKPIAYYNLSTPPPVFVKRGFYKNGALQLEVVNTNDTQAVMFDAGIRATETSPVKNNNRMISLEPGLLSELEITTDGLFDIGFRIGDGLATPDDLFLSDGPWGIDDSQAETTISKYEVTTNTLAFEAHSLPIERNVIVRGRTATALSVYRALTPRFQAVDVSDFNSLRFNAKGSGRMEVTFVKKGITRWEDQFRAYVNLTPTNTEQQLFFSQFKSTKEKVLTLDDLITIVFTLYSSDGTIQEKEVSLEQLRFSLMDTVPEIGSSGISNQVLAYPNPFSEETTIKLPKPMANGQITVFDLQGRVVDIQKLTMQQQENIVTYKAPEVIDGLYLYRIDGSNGTSYSGKFIIAK